MRWRERDTPNCTFETNGSSMWPFQINMKSHTRSETSKCLTEMCSDGAGGSRKWRRECWFYGTFCYVVHVGMSVFIWSFKKYIKILLDC